MFIVLLKFSDNKKQASEFMEGHNEWIRCGFDDGVFLLAGSLQPGLGGGIVAYHTSLTDLQTRVNDDPFVAHNVVGAEILEITPAKADARLQFLLDQVITLISGKRRSGPGNLNISRNQGLTLVNDQGLAAASSFLRTMSMCRRRL